MRKLFTACALVGISLIMTKILTIPTYALSEAPDELLENRSGQKIEPYTNGELPEGNGGYSDNGNKNSILRGLCEKYNYYRVWITSDVQVTNWRVLVCNGDIVYKDGEYKFKEAQYYSFNSNSNYIAYYFLEDSYKSSNWQRNYSNVPADGLPALEGVSNDATKINQQIVTNNIFILLFGFLFSLTNICIFGRTCI